MAMLKVTDLQVYYGVIQALKGISFEVKKGDIFIIPPYVPHNILADENKIAETCDRLAAQINADYPDHNRELVFVIVLKGSVLFATDLIRRINRPCTMEFMKVSSYGAGVETSGFIQVSLDLKRDIKELWVYYCCGPEKIFPNSFIAMPSARVQVLGYMLYKYDIKGFLHWGLNFYNSQFSIRHIDPYKCTDSEGAFPGGDPYIIYPGDVPSNAFVEESKYPEDVKVSVEKLVSIPCTILMLEPSRYMGMYPRGIR